jgi:hypothetical protein
MQLSAKIVVPQFSLSLNTILGPLTITIIAIVTETNMATEAAG